MQRVALISPFDEVCLPLRYASSVLQTHGRYQTEVILLKGLQYVAPQNVPAEEQREDGGYYGFVSWITPKEKRLLLDELKRIDPIVVGLYVSPLHFGLASFITQAIQSELNKPVVWSGVDPSLNPEACIEVADMLIVGECEEAYTDLTTALDTKSEITKIPNVWVKQDGQLYRNDPRPWIENLDHLPIADFELSGKTVICDDLICQPPFPPKSPLYTNLITRTSRGCKLEPSYYFNGLEDAIYRGHGGIRRRSVDHLVHEMKYRVRNWPAKLQHVEFMDGNFPEAMDWTERFGEEFGSEIGLPFSGYVHPGAVEFPTLPKLCYYGLDYLVMGIVSASQRTIDTYYGGSPSYEAILECATQVDRSGIHLIVEAVGSNPLETEDDRKVTLNLLCDLPKPFGMKRTLPMAFFDNTPIGRMAETAGIADVLECPEGVHGRHAKPNALDIFWDQAFVLAHMKNFSKDLILHFADQAIDMKQNPGLFQEYMDVMYRTTYADSNPLLDMDEYVGHLRWKTAQLERSTIYRTFKKVQTLVPR